MPFQRVPRLVGQAAASAIARSRYGWAVSVLLLHSASPSLSAADDTWPRYGHDGALSGRTALKGQITAPRVAWSYSLAGTTVTLELTPAQGSHELTLPGTGDQAPVAHSTLRAASREEGPNPASRRAVRKAISERWDLGPAKLDIDGTGRLRNAPEQFHERWAKLLPDVRGLQRVAWSHTWGTGKVARLQCFAYDQGHDKPRLACQSDPPEGDMFNPLNVVVDIDGDGIQEICTAAHYRLMIYKGTTGKKVTELRYHNNRPYGWFGLFDVDADGQMESITIGDFQSHVDVLKYDRTRPEPDRLRVLWRRDIETDITARAKWPHVGPRPVVNVCGDARPEIVLSVFNDTGDNQWHVEVIDAARGKLLCDMPQRFAQGSADVTGDGKEELFCVATEGVVAPPMGRIELCAIEEGKAKVLWSATEAGWASADLPRLGSNWSTTATNGMKHVLVTPGDKTRRPSWLVWRRSGQGRDAGAASRNLRLTAMTMGEGGQAAELWTLADIAGQPGAIAIRAEADGMAPSACIKVTLSANSHCKLAGQGVRAAAVGSVSVGGPLAPPIVARLKNDEPPAVLAEGAGEQIFAIGSTGSTSGQPKLIWQASGRGMTSGSRWAGLVAADLDGDGGFEILAADETPDGLAELIALRHDGTALWRTRFEGIPGQPPIWNVGGLTCWWPGRFRQPDKIDVFVDLRRSLMHSDIGVMVDGRTGQIVWRQEKAVSPSGQFHWGYAGSVLAVADMNADGLDELINIYPVCYWIADGRTGKLIEAADLASRKALPAWAAYGEPIVRDFTGSGEPEVLLDSPYILALLRRDGQPVWHGLPRADYPTGAPQDNVGETTDTRHCLIGFSGDGRFAIAASGYKDGVRTIDPKDGKILWRLSAPKPTCEKVAAADINGDGGDELIYPAGNDLIAITGDGRQGRVLWTWKGPTALSMPAIADVDGDGKAEIVVRSADGVIHCLE